MTEEPDRRREAQGADGREEVRDIVLGTATAEDYSAADVTPVAENDVDELLEMTNAAAAPTRRRAVLALAEREPSTRVLARLERLARDDPDDEVRQFAVEATAKLDGDPAVARERLEEDDDQWVRAEAAVALDRLDRAGHEERFVSLLSDEAPAVRRNALISLSRIRGDEMRDHLLRALEDPDDRVREWAAKLLGSFDDDPKVDEALTAVAESGDEVDVVRETAARSLGATGEEIEDIVEGDTGTETAGDHMLNQAPDL